MFSLGVELRRALVLQLSATISSNGWMAEWSKAADSRNPFLPHQKWVYSVLVRGARSNRAPVNFCSCTQHALQHHAPRVLVFSFLELEEAMS